MENLEKNDKLSEINTTVEESVNPYFTDVFSPWETKEQLRVWKEVKGDLLPLAACLIQSWTQSISTWSQTTITWLSTVSWDSWMTATADRITIIQDWTYLVSISIFDATWSATWVRNAVIVKNWSNAFIARRIASATSSLDCSASYPLVLVAWDYLELASYQDSWSSMTASTAFISAVKIA